MQSQPGEDRDLELKNARFAAAFENMSHGICMFDPGERMVLCNGHYIRMFGLDPDFMRAGVTLLEILRHSIDRGTASQPLGELYAERRSFVARRQPGQYEETLSTGRIVAISYRPLDDGGWVSIYEDVTERRLGEQALREQHRRFDAALSNMSQGLLMFDDQSRLAVRNARYLELYGLQPEDQPIGATRAELIQTLVDKGIYVDFDVAKSVAEHMQAMKAGRVHTIEHEIADGRTLLVRHRPMPGGGYVTTFDDVTSSRRDQESIRHLAHHDALTGLANRVSFAQRLQAALAQSLLTGRPLAVLSLDLDRFKAVNDTMGHPVGDATLRMVAKRLSRIVRDGIDTVSRVGGDEFAILLPDADRQVAERLARRASRALSARYRLADGSPVSIGVSIGVALSPGDGVEMDHILKNADLALYRAKAEGRNTWRFYEADMDASMRHRKALEVDLRQALARGELAMHYQKLVDSGDGRIVGFEPLMRWSRRGGEMVPPGEFIPLAEETGVIVELGDWALEQACQEACNWPEPLYVAVNISAVQLRQEDFVAKVARTLRRTGLAPRRLELEITETMLVEHTEIVTGALARLKAMGVQIALDDFGTGYSSLSYLRRFPFDRLKIDRSFIAEIEDADTAAIVATIVTLARRLGMSTTAEGIETVRQLQVARAAGCGHAQGFLFSPAVPAHEIQAQLDENAVACAA